MRSHAKAASAATTDGNGIGRGVLSWLLLAALACAALMASVSPAVAATAGTSYGYKGDIVGTPDSFNVVAEEMYQSVAVSAEDGRVFLVRQFDSPESAIDVLAADGTPVVRVPTTGLASNVAVSSDGSFLFMSEHYTDHFAVKYVSDGAPTPTYTVDPSWAPSVSLHQLGGYAVDPTSGDLILGAEGGVYRFDADSGALLSSFDGSTTAQGSFRATLVAAAPNGDVYAVAGPGRLEQIGADGSYKGELKVPQPSGGAFRPFGLAVNPQSGDVAVALPQGGENVIKIYSAAHDLKDTIRLPGAVAGDMHGMAFSGDGTKLYLGQGDGSARALILGTRPGVDPPVASDITSTSAHLTAAVATDGEPTTARIEYCLPSEPCERYLGSEDPSPWHVIAEETGFSDDPHSLEADFSGLAPNTEYLVRATAVNEESMVEGISATASFSTPLAPPDVQTGAAGSVTDTTAQLAGTITAFGDQTTYHFEYGLSTSYGSNAPAGTEGIAGNERSPRAFTQNLKGLQPGTTYHYRLVATNAAGASLGEDRTFTTRASGDVAPQRGYEMVTPLDKKGVSIYNNFGFQASEDGAAFVYTASAPSSEAEGSAQTSRYLSRRGANGWTGLVPLNPPINPVRAITFAPVHAASEDFEHAFVVSQKALTPGAFEGAANFYVADLDTGAYHFVGTTTEVVPFANYVGPTSAQFFIAGAPDFSWVVFAARHPLLPGAPKVAIYKWTKTGGLSLASLLPGDIVPTGNAWLQSDERTINPLVSDDGETIAFSIVSGEKGVYLRSGGQTEAISVSQASGGPSGVQPGIADAISRDGRYVIFQSQAELTDGATALGYKMYRYDASSGQLEYLGPLDTSTDGSVDVLGMGDDGETVYFNSDGQLVAWRDGQLDVVSPEKSVLADVSPNGRYFSYLRSGVAHLYDAVSGDDVCTSCTSDGTAYPANMPLGRNFGNRSSRVVTDDGHAYFDTTAALNSADRNGSQDVYEYFNGRLTLISPGQGNFPATFADISVDGSTVFFTTSEGLVKQDIDRGYDVYAARIGGGFPDPPSPPAECSGEACRASVGASPTAPNLGSSAAKNLRGSKPAAVRCRKGSHKVRKNGKARCVKNKTRKRDTKHNRGAGR